MKGEDFKRANIEYWTDVEIKAVVTSSVPFEDGTNKLQKSMTMTYVDFDGKTKIDGARYETILSNKQIDINLNGSINLDNINIVWTTNPAIDDKILLNGRNQTTFSVTKDSLPQEKDYTFTATLFLKKANQKLWSDYKVIRVNTPPRRGTLKISSSEGEALRSNFRLEAPDWYVLARPARYQFFYTDMEGREFKLNPLRNEQDISNIYLSEAKEVYVLVVDQAGVIEKESVQVRSTIG